MIGILLLLFVGLFMSAFFSGSETGFYRVTRLRLMLDALDGDLVARGLLWLTNNPALFVATTLVGNNLANYATSLAIVLAVHALPFENEQLVEVLAPLALSPLLFIYAELLPKNVFYHAPNLLLRKGGPLFLLCTLLFAPVSALLWSLGRLLQSLLGEAPLKVQLTLARKELQKMLEEGQEAGLLRPAQRQLAQNLFAVANRPVSELCTPLSRVASVDSGIRRDEALRLARRHQWSLLAVTPPGARAPSGYVRVVDLLLSDGPLESVVRPLQTFPHDRRLIDALLQLRGQGEAVARVRDDRNRTVGLLYADVLAEGLFRGT